MDKKVKCKGCNKKDFMNKLIKQHKMNHRGKKIYVFYHEKCIDRDKKIFTEHSNGFKSSESLKHHKAKELVFEWIINNKTRLTDQFGEDVKLSYDYIGIESPIMKQSGLKTIPYIKDDSCSGCINKDIEYNAVHRYADTLKIAKGLYKEHPCIKCPYNKINYICIFDIGVGYKGKYNAALEILNTSKVKDGKLIHCMRNGIELFEIDANEILNETSIPKTIKCERLWWKVENTYQVANQYKHLLRGEK